MQKPFSNALIALVVLIVIGGGGYLYMTRSTKEASEHPEKPAQTLTPTGNEKLFRLSSTDSSASYTLHEVLRGSPVTVIGKTNQLDGDIALDRTHANAARLGTIRIDAQTLKTDNDRRDNTVKRMILKSEDDANEYIVFKAKSVVGVPETVSNNVPFPLTIVGDLTVTGATKEVTFTGQGSFTADDQLIADVKTTVHYADFGLAVPKLSFLANVEEDAVLDIHAVAKQTP